MLYLLAGAPRIGKSTIARQFANLINSRIISTDELKILYKGPSVIFYNDVAKNIITPKQRVDAVKIESKQVSSKIKGIIKSTIKENQNTIFEGVHLLPFYVKNFIKMYGNDSIRAIYIGSRNIDLILEGIVKNTSENDWLKDFNLEVKRQVAVFSKEFSNYIYIESKKYNLPYKERSTNFQKDISHVIEYFS